MKRPWHDTVLLDLLAGYGAFIILAVALLTLSECVLPPAHAGVFLEVQAGASYMVNTAPDGLWKQEAFGTSYQGVKLAYGGRIGYRFQAPYSIQAGLIRFGTSRTETDAVADECYNPITHTVTCNVQAMHIKTVNSMTGYTVSGTRYLALTDTWSVPVSLGMALVTARLRADNLFEVKHKQERYARIPMWSVGAGLCWREQVCWETTLYQAIPAQNYHDPVTTQIVASLVSIKIPIPH